MIKALYQRKRITNLDMGIHQEMLQDSREHRDQEIQNSQGQFLKRAILDRKFNNRPVTIIKTKLKIL